jgi:2-keto-4-pentenoate hydratase
MLARHREELAAGAEHMGWKVGFGAPAAMERLGIDRPLVGALTTGRRLPLGASVSVAGWARGLIEAEIAAYVGRDIGAEATPEEAFAAVDAWSLAIELADLDLPPDDIEEILAGNVYHRHVLLGDLAPADLDPTRVSVTVRRDGAEVAATDRPHELVGDLGWVLATTASTLAACGGALRAGDVVITGSVVPPIEVAPGQAWQVTAEGLGEVAVRLVES